MHENAMMYREKGEFMPWDCGYKVNNKYRFGREKRMADEHVMLTSEVD